MKTGSLLAFVLLVAVAVAHLLRLLLATPVMVGAIDLPLWVSVIAVLVPGFIAWLLWKESR